MRNIISHWKTLRFWVYYLLTYCLIIKMEQRIHLGIWIAWIVRRYDWNAKLRLWLQLSLYTMPTSLKYKLQELGSYWTGISIFSIWVYYLSSDHSKIKKIIIKKTLNRQKTCWKRQSFRRIENTHMPTIFVSGISYLVHASAQIGTLTLISHHSGPGTGSSHYWLHGSKHLLLKPWLLQLKKHCE